MEYHWKMKIVFRYIIIWDQEVYLNNLTSYYLRKKLIFRVIVDRLLVTKMAPSPIYPHLSHSTMLKFFAVIIALFWSILDWSWLCARRPTVCSTEWVYFSWETKHTLEFCVLGQKYIRHWRNQFRSCFFLQNLRLNDHSAAWQPGVNGSLSRGKLNTGDSVIDFKLNPEMGQRCSPETHWNESTQLSQAVLCSRSDVCTAIVTGS